VPGIQKKERPGSLRALYGFSIGAVRRVVQAHEKGNAR